MSHGSWTLFEASSCDTIAYKSDRRSPCFAFAAHEAHRRAGIGCSTFQLVSSACLMCPNHFLPKGFVFAQCRTFPLPLPQILPFLTLSSAARAVGDGMAPLTLSVTVATKVMLSVVAAALIMTAPTASGFGETECDTWSFAKMMRVVSRASR